MRKNVETKRVKRSPIMGKRIAAGVLAGLMVIGSLMGCGSGDSDNTNNYSVMQKVCPMEFRSIYLPIHDMVPGIDTAEYAKKVYELGCEKYGKDTMEEILSLSAYKILLNMFRLNLFEHLVLCQEKVQIKSGNFQTID